MPRSCAAPRSRRKIDRGHRYTFATRRVVVERTGALRAVIRLDGALVERDGPGLARCGRALEFLRRPGHRDRGASR